MNETLTTWTSVIDKPNHPELMWPMFLVLAGLGVAILSWGIYLWIKRCRQKKEREGKEK